MSVVKGMDGDETWQRGGSAGDGARGWRGWGGEEVGKDLEAGLEAGHALVEEMEEVRGQQAMRGSGCGLRATGYGLRARGVQAPGEQATLQWQSQSQSLT